MGCPDSNSDSYSFIHTHIYIYTYCITAHLCVVVAMSFFFLRISSSGTLLLRLDLLHLYDKFVADVPKESQDFGKAKPADRVLRLKDVEGTGGWMWSTQLVKLV